MSYVIMYANSSQGGSDYVGTQGPTKVPRAAHRFTEAEAQAWIAANPGVRRAEPVILFMPEQEFRVGNLY